MTSPGPDYAGRSGMEDGKQRAQKEGPQKRHAKNYDPGSSGFPGPGAAKQKYTYICPPLNRSGVVYLPSRTVPVTECPRSSENTPQ